MTTFQRLSNVLFIYVLSGVLLSAYGYQFLKHEEPCPLCLLQRLAMLGIAIPLLCNLRFGIKAEHYGLALISACIGKAVSLRQIALHICPQFPTFGEPVLGFDLYVWAFIVFTAATVSIAILLILFGFTKHEDELPTWRIWEITAFSLVALIVAGNIVTTFIDCGFLFCPD